MVHHVFAKIREAKGSNEKLRIATEEFGPAHHSIMECCFNFEVYGISGAGIAKAIGYDKKKHGRVEDLGQWLMDNPYSNDVEHSAPIAELVTILLDSSGNQQIDNMKLFLLQKVATRDMPWYVRAIQKNMRIGLNLVSYNKIRKAHNLPEITPYSVQLCGKMPIEEMGSLEYPRIAEYKYDGERSEIDITIRDSFIQCKLKSRSGSDITERYPEVIAFFTKAFAGSRHRHIKLDSEIISSDFITLSTRMHRKAENIKSEDSDLRAIVFDVMEMDGENLKVLTQRERRALVDALSDEYGFDTSFMKIVENYDELLAFYKQARDIGQEGVVTKSLDMQWNFGSRDGWVKMVPKETLDLEIIEAYYGTGKNSNFINGVIVANKSRTIKTKVSSGIKDHEREELTKLFNEQDLIGKIVEVEFREKQPPKDGVSALRFPVFKRLRDDKFEPDL